MPVSVRELKTDLSEYLRRVQRGESVEVISHGRVVAELVPPRRQDESAVERLRRQPWYKPARASGSVGLERPEVLGHGASLSATVIPQRRRKAR
jgi:prevent-host-death family protein